jgi:hypothetical protein
MEFTESVKSFHVPATPLHLRLSAQLSFRAHLTRHARHLRGERTELVHHLVDRPGGAQELALQRAALDFQRHGLRQVALRHGADHARRFRRRVDEVLDQRVHAVDLVAPETPGLRHLDALLQLAFLADFLAQARQLVGHATVQLHDFVERLGDLARHPGPFDGQAYGAIALLEAAERREERAHFLGGEHGFGRGGLRRLALVGGALARGDR